MADIAVRPKWASPPGETILAVLHAKGMSVDLFRHEIGLNESQAAELFAGVMPVTPLLAKDLSRLVGSTAHFWMERQKQFRNTLDELAASEPELLEWGASFPVQKMIESGWLPKPYAKTDIAFELLDFFDIESVEEWRKRYPARLGLTKFRTSQVLENDLPTTIAWIRRGEVLAENIECGAWNRDGFHACLRSLKPLSRESDPEKFLPKLRKECAKYGVAVVVARSINGCAASGATIMLNKQKALLLLSARFLSDDQFWFSFFHEAGHLLLHSGEPHIEYDDASTSKQEDEANRFAEGVILESAGESTLQNMQVNSFSIARLARQCDVSPGVIVGQLQFRGRISPKTFNKFKIRYRVGSFNL